MIDVGLYDGMFVVVKEQSPKDNDIVVVEIDGKNFIKQYKIINNKIEFHSKNKNYPNIIEYESYSILGVLDSFFY